MVEDGFDVFVVLVLPSALFSGGIQAWVDGHTGHNGAAHIRGRGLSSGCGCGVGAVESKDARMRRFVPKYMPAWLPVHVSGAMQVTVAPPPVTECPFMIKAQGTTNP